MGYYTASGDAIGAAVLTTAAKRITALTVNAGATVDLQLAGVAGLPALGSGIDTVAVKFQVSSTTTAGGVQEAFGRRPRRTHPHGGSASPIPPPADS